MQASAPQGLLVADGYVGRTPMPNRTTTMIARMFWVYRPVA